MSRVAGYALKASCTALNVTKASFSALGVGS